MNGYDCPQQKPAVKDINTCTYLILNTGNRWAKSPANIRVICCIQSAQYCDLDSQWFTNSPAFFADATCSWHNIYTACYHELKKCKKSWFSWQGKLVWKQNHSRAMFKMQKGLQLPEPCPRTSNDKTANTNHTWISTQLYPEEHRNTLDIYT